MSDYISREAALTELQNPELFNVSPRFLQILRDLPAADVEPVVHGRKIEDGDIGGFWLCSLCGEWLPYGANYCPSCGARMDGESE